MALDVRNQTKKSPLTDRFGRRHTYLRVSVTDRCNLRCQYCMPAEGIPWIPRQEILTYEEIERIVGVLAGAGVEKVRITGGEPTVRKGITDLIAGIARTKGIKDLAMTTNGTTLAKMAQAYGDAGLTQVNVSIDSLQEEKYKEITRTDKLQTVLDGLDAAVDAGFGTIKVNVVAMKGVNEDEIPAFVELAKRKGINVRFIEFMPFDGNEWTKDRMLTYREMRAVVERHAKVTPIERAPSQVAKDFRIDGSEGTVSFITSMTEDFCSDCNRLRLTATGEFKPCLFMLPNVSVRDIIRDGGSDDDILEAVHGSLEKKWVGHPSPQELIRLKNSSMVQIGG
ncbi:MAG TPA: GTP 3',8-cyclase MoaA [Fimbriimonadaceae bacterium]|nr:GTP 3',8-cyclase MoaA [Fimbriimonadaceae bacterium]